MKIMGNPLFPDGANTEHIVNQVKGCPSGALSYQLNEEVNTLDDLMRLYYFLSSDKSRAVSEKHVKIHIQDCS